MWHVFPRRLGLFKTGITSWWLVRINWICNRCSTGSFEFGYGVVCRFCAYNDKLFVHGCGQIDLSRTPRQSVCSLSRHRLWGAQGYFADAQDWYLFTVASLSMRQVPALHRAHQKGSREDGNCAKGSVKVRESLDGSRCQLSYLGLVPPPLCPNKFQRLKLDEVWSIF